MDTNNNNQLIQQLNEIKFLSAIKNIDRATSSVLENSMAIFLPFKRIDKTDIYKKFIDNNQILEIRNDLFYKVEIRGRLLGQGHKDILEVLLSSNKIYSKKNKKFKVVETATSITKKLGRNIGKKQWVIQRLQEIAECRVVIHSKDQDDNNLLFNFGFIDSILGKNDNELEINFTQSYTYFLAANELISYHNYINDIIKLDEYCNKVSKKNNLKHNINSDFIKAVVRYMLQHRGNNSQIKIENLIDRLNLVNLISAEQLKDNIIDLKRDEIIQYLQDKFGITLTNNKNTITFKSKEDKKHYIIQTQSLF